MQFLLDCQCGLRQTWNQKSGLSYLRDQILQYYIMPKIQRSHCLYVPTQLPFYFKDKRVKRKCCFLGGDKVYL